MKTIFSKFTLFRWMILVIIVILIVLINVIGHYTSFRYDMTEDQRYSLSTGTESYLEKIKTLDNRINMKLYLEGELPSELRSFKNALEEKLKDFKATAGDRIKYSFIDPNDGSANDRKVLFEDFKANGVYPTEVKYKNNGKVTRLIFWPVAVLSFSGGVIAPDQYIQLIPPTPMDNPLTSDNIQNVVERAINNLEYELVNGIRKITSIRKKKIGLLQGHGELNGKDLLHALSLISPFYSIDTVSIRSNTLALNDFDAIIIADPQTPYSESDLFTLDQFVMKGGNLLCFMNTLKIPQNELFLKGSVIAQRKNLNLQNMLFDYGFKINDNLLIDANYITKFDPRFEDPKIPWYYKILSTNTKNSIVKNIEPVSLEYVNQIEFTNNKVEPILTTSTNSYKSGLSPLIQLDMASMFDQTDLKLAPNPNDENNKLCIAAMIDGYLDSYSYNRVVIKDTNNPYAKKIKKSIKPAKIVVIGNGSCFSNSYYEPTFVRNIGQWELKKQYNGPHSLYMDHDDYSLKIQRKLGNADFFMNTIDFIMDNSYMLEIRSKQVDIRAIDKSKVTKNANYYKLINLVLPITMILILGIIIALFRRIRYTKP